jgi:AraC-like DNA-binding protein
MSTKKRVLELLSADPSRSLTDVAREIGVSTERVRQIVPGWVRAKLKARDAIIADMRRSGMKLEEIAQETGVHNSQVHKICARLAIPVPPVPLKPCGTLASYNRGCRCSACRRANADSMDARIAERRGVGLPTGDPRHGTGVGYNYWGCRCDRCIEAHSARCLAYYHRRAKSVDRSAGAA